MQYDVHTSWRALRWYMLQPQFQSCSLEVHDQRPFRITIAISSNDDYTRADRAKLIENRLRTNVAEMPDLIGAFRGINHLFRQPIVGVREHENALRLLL